MFLDRVYEGARVAGGWNEVVPAARREVSALTVHSCDVRCNWIQSTKVVQQPAIETVRLQGRLHGRYVDNRRICRYLRGHPAQYSRTYNRTTESAPTARRHAADANARAGGFFVFRAVVADPYV